MLGIEMSTHLTLGDSALCRRLWEMMVHFLGISILLDRETNDLFDSNLKHLTVLNVHMLWRMQI